ncbi:MAG: desulfoferrodoxin [Bacilli bacterium]|nr:desulfoferrodoxin [Bacilli bacterium]
MKFYKEVKSNNVVIVPNGEVVSADFKEITANTVDAAKEKHVPVVSYGDDKMTVTVGSLEHPMGEDHYIMWIAVVKGDNVQIQKLNPGDKPIATFEKQEKAQVYAYCNLHGLWKA